MKIKVPFYHETEMTILCDVEIVDDLNKSPDGPYAWVNGEGLYVCGSNEWRLWQPNDKIWDQESVDHFNSLTENWLVFINDMEAW